MKLPFDAVLFDFDGTIADTGRGIFNCIKYAADYYGWAYPDDEGLRSFVGPPLHVSFSRVFGLDEEQSLAAVEKYRERYRAGGMLELDIYDGIEELVKRLRSLGVKTAVVTSKPDRFIHRILAHYGIEGFFDCVCAPLDKNGDTSKCELINRAVGNLCCSKETTVMVGDRMYDIQGAKLAGVKSVGILWGYGTREELENAGADNISESVEELYNLLVNQ